jgi:peptidoglycan/LPS O-acetylase OafA/YrhL
MGRIGATPSSGKRIAGIEGLRAVAACSILVYHTWLYSSPNGEFTSVGPLTRFMPDLAFGVVLFFTLSGFLLFRPFAGAIIRGKPLPGVRKYLRNRALRIVPAYWVILVATALIFQSVLVRGADGDLHNGGLFDPSQLARDLLLVQNYDPNTLGTGIGPAWSLAVEVVFYAMLPLLVLLAWCLARKGRTRRARRLAAVAPAGLLLLIGLVGKAVAAYMVEPVRPFAGWEADWHSVIERSFLCQADLFAFGMMLAVLRVDSEDGVLRLPRGWRFAAGSLAVVSYLATAKFTYFSEHLSYSPFNTLMAFACALVLALVVLPSGHTTRPPLLLRLFETRPFVAAGLISYSIFLWHEQLARWLRVQGLTLSGTDGFFADVGMVAVATAALSTLTYLWVEAPAMRLKFRRRAGDEPLTPQSTTVEQAAP